MKHKIPTRIAAGLLALLLTACSTNEAMRSVAATPVAAPSPVQATAVPTVRPEFPGFTLVIRKGEELYCQKRSPTGSRARVVESCYTRDQMRRMAENSDEYFKQAGSASSHDSLRMDSPR
jgi:hypothetical protein